MIVTVSKAIVKSLTENLLERFSVLILLSI